MATSSISTTSPCPRKPTSASASIDTLYPPQSHCNSIQKGQRIFGGDLGLNRGPSTRRIAHNFNQIIFDTPQLFRFIGRRPTLRAREKGRITFLSGAFIFEFRSQTSDDDVLSVRILCTASEWQLSSLEEVSTSSLPPVPTLEDLYTFEKQGYDEYEELCWQDEIKNSLWLDLVRSFVPLNNLYYRGNSHLVLCPPCRNLSGEERQKFCQPWRIFS